MTLRKFPPARVSFVLKRRYVQEYVMVYRMTVQSVHYTIELEYVMVYRMSGLFKVCTIQ